MKAKIIRTRRRFGIELEVIGEEIVQSLLPDGVKVVADGSLSHGGREFITPPLQGTKAEQKVLELTRFLDSSEFVPDRSCGFHVHIAAREFKYERNVEKLKALMLFYLVFEDVLATFVSRSRRGNNFARGMRQAFQFRSIIEAKTKTEVEQLWYRTSIPSRINRMKKEKYHQSRYFYANFHSLLSAGHIEIRSHQGTTNADKILHWVQLHASIMDAVAVGKVTAHDLFDTVRFSFSVEKKTEYMFRLLESSEALRGFFRMRQKQLNPVTDFAGVPAKSESDFLSGDEIKTVEQLLYPVQYAATDTNPALINELQLTYN